MHVFFSVSNLCLRSMFVCTIVFSKIVQLLCPVFFSLWKKERENMYRDPFNTAVIDASDVRIWTAIFSDSNGTPKCQQKSMELTQLGIGAVNNRQWSQAINYFNHALSCTERHTLSESVLYVNRAQCFSQLGMHDEALTDYDLVLSSGAEKSDDFLKLVNHLWAEEERLKQQLNPAHQLQPEMKFNSNNEFPCMTAGFEINKSETFGRYIFSTKTIPVGDIVFEAEPFAMIAMPSKQTHCTACFGTNMNFIPCQQCNALFCVSCYSNSKRMHDWVCKTNFDVINDMNLKLIIQSVLVAISTFSSLEDMILFVENIVADDNNLGKIPESAVDFQSRYAVFLGLAQSEINTECLLDAYLAFKYFTGVSKLNDLLSDEWKKRFFMNLLVHHAAVIPRNMFEDTFNNIVCAQIYDVLSLFNHSCEPQLEFGNIRKNGKFSQLISRLPIKKGEQVFIDYLGGATFTKHELRKEYLRQSWGFDCKCKMCSR